MSLLLYHSKKKRIRARGWEQKVTHLIQSNKLIKVLVIGTLHTD